MNAPRGGKLIFRPFMPSPDRIRVPGVYSHLHHPLFSWLGLRPIFASTRRRSTKLCLQLGVFLRVILGRIHTRVRKRRWLQRISLQDGVRSSSCDWVTAEMERARRPREYHDF